MRTLLISLFFILINTYSIPVNANGVIDSIGKLILSNNAQQLSNFIRENVDITIFNEDQTYSKHQAKQVLEDFFKKHQIQNFEILHKGSSGNHSEFAIANLDSKKSSFRAYILVNKLENHYQLIELRIEEE